jgi:hypothetical protein
MDEAEAVLEGGVGSPGAEDLANGMAALSAGLAREAAMLAQGRVLEAAGAPGVEVGAAGSILERAGRRQLLALALSAIVAGEADAAQLAEAVGEAAASVGLKGADAAALLRAAAMGLGMDDAAARIAALAMVQDVAARLG